MKRITVFLMGCGGVGRQLLDHIVACRSIHAKQGLALRVVGICDSRCLLTVNDVFDLELKDELLKEICRIKSTGSSLSSLMDLGHCQILEDSEATEKSIEIASLLGRSTDPRDDLGGMDVARKALILARLLGQLINLEDIKVDSLYPDDMGPKSMSIDDFINRGLLLLDRDVGKKVEVAASKGNVLRYVCIIEGFRCQVGIQELPKDSPLGRLRGSDNVVEIYSRCYKNSPLLIQGAGAGNDTTAAGVLADIVDLQDLFK